MNLFPDRSQKYNYIPPLIDVSPTMDLKKFPGINSFTTHAINHFPAIEIPQNAHPSTQIHTIIVSP